MTQGRHPISRLQQHNIVALKTQGFTYKEIARKVKVSLRTVQRYLISAGLVRHYPDTLLHGNTQSGIIGKIRSDMSVGEIAKHYRISQDAVERIASMNGIGLRGRRIHDAGKFTKNLYSPYLKRKSA